MARKYKHPYIARHTDGGWRYQRGIPKDLQALLGDRTHFSVYLKGAENETRAGTLARVLAGQHDGLFARLRRLTAAQQVEIAQYGGVDSVSDSLPLLRKLVKDTEEMRTPMRWHDPYLVEELTGGRESAQSAALLFHDWYKKTDADRSIEAQLVRFEAISAAVAPAPQSDDYSFKGLWRLWIKVRKPKKTDDHLRTVERLIKVCGDIDFRAVTQAHIAKFRDELETMATTRESERTDEETARKWQVRQLQHVGAMFAVAVSEAKIAANPAKGIKVRGKAAPRKTGDDRPFTGAQVKRILDMAKRTRFGDNGKTKRHEAALWVLRLLAYTGARPAEITQLRKVDVEKVNGVPVIRVRAEHEQQSVKNGESIRNIPLHPAVASFVDYAAKLETDFVFACFPWNKHKGRRGWFDAEFGPFMRDVCSIDEDSLTLYSMRHRFHDAMRNAKIEDDRQRYLVGHAGGGEHGKYGRGAGLRELAADLARINPFRD